MPALASPKHEKFCQLIVSGTSIIEAYGLAGFKPDAPNAHRLRRKDYIEKRIDELQARAVRRAEISGKRILEELAKIAFHNPAEYLHFNDDGSAELDLAAMTADQMAAISEITCVTQMDRNGGSRTRIAVKLYDKKGALETLGKHYGLWSERLEIGRPGDFSNVQTPEQLREKLRAELGPSDAEEFIRLIEQGDPRAIDHEPA